MVWLSIVVENEKQQQIVIWFIGCDRKPETIEWGEKAA